MKEIPINMPFFDKREVSEVKKVIEEGNLTSSTFQGGNRVREVESMFCKFVGTKYTAALNSGTSALQASLMALGIGKNDEVLLPSFTFVATANAVLAVGAIPVFVDIKKDDYTMDPEDLEDRITDNSKAIIPVHLYGHVADIRRIMEIANKNSLYVIEDACQSLGSTLHGKQTGSFGDIGCFSFYASKVITSGEGGAVATNSKELVDKIKMIRNHGMFNGYDTRILGLNFRMTEICAAITKVQLKKVEKILQIRRKNATTLTKMLSDLDIVLPREGDGSRYNWYLYTIALDNRDVTMKKLNSMGIGATAYYKTPTHRTPFYSIYRVNLPNTEWAADHVLSLPVHPSVSVQDIGYIVDAVRKVLNAEKRN
ncbi:MAG: DegT/DnrJ/EryC1/StrS family aminotransferase [Nitrososphaerales archaeon]